jgi:hypothetical protein
MSVTRYIRVPYTEGLLCVLILIELCILKLKFKELKSKAKQKLRVT